MAEEHISIEVEGLDKVLFGIGRADHRVHEGLRDILDDLRHRGEHYIRLYAPAHSGEILRRIASTAPAPFMDGMQAVAGVRSGSDKHPLYVHQGTGIYRGGRMGGRVPVSVPTAGTSGRIYAKTPGAPMTFQKRGEPRRWRQWTRGQRANPFVLYAFQQLVPYARGRIRRFDVTHGRS